MSAALKVFCIPKLLEPILSKLPPLDIIRYQSVNHTWHRLIADSPLLQYKAWLRADCPVPTQEVQNDDFEGAFRNWEQQVDDDAYVERAVVYNISKHLNPVLVRCFMQHMPTKLRFVYFDDYLSLNPACLRALMYWYEAHKERENVWGHMALCRPDVSAIRWGTGASDDSGIPLELEALHDEDADSSYKISLLRRGQAYKRPGEPLVLTLRDLMRSVKWQWKRWLESEMKLHDRRHGRGCDHAGGLPQERCFKFEEVSDDEERRSAVAAKKAQLLDALIEKLSR
ncbi:hypothetical protein P171DRAFT_429495 [Karstenula rhodostoma CBS 690.94]|uniref:F-box domain-containing protein n=1 Tax=Karstenula rhodostoma CBS 690.94 TaxID=1392251 RepID=A0A9P4PRZ3_9PLEO|nr:hypothetical protein P171DRAFT_429495 [Karstenula rhodostoma CBS 690.94]